MAIRSLAIDPGLQGTGWAVFYGVHPMRCGVIRVRKPVDFHARSSEIARELAEIAVESYIGQVYIEYPSFFDSARGHMVARRGDLLKLCYLVGVISGRLGPTATELVPVAQWKGQLPKEVVESRIRKTLGNSIVKRLGIRTHAWDAVGIGLYKHGRF